MNDKQNKLIDDLALEMKEAVTVIENGIKTTQDNYGPYMNLISYLGKGNKNMEKVMAIALMRAKANANGVRNALKVLGHEGF